MIKTATHDDLKGIAALHTECFPDYFLTKLGLNLLIKYYKEFMTIDDIFIIDVDDKFIINGLLVGTQISSVGRNNFIKHNYITLGLRVLWLCIKLDKDTWDRVFGFIKFFKKQSDNNDDTKTKEYSWPSEIEPRLLSVCVSSRCRGKGIAKSMMEEFERRLIVEGYHGYALTVHKLNVCANNFYKKMGMVICKETNSEYEYRKTT